MDEEGTVFGLTPIDKIKILLRRMLIPDKEGIYEPSKEVLKFNGYEKDENGTQLLSFTFVSVGIITNSGYKRFFNQNLAKYFYKLMNTYKIKETGLDWTAEGDFFKTVKKGVVYQVLKWKNGNSYAEKTDDYEAVAKNNGWVNIQDNDSNFKKLEAVVAESKYPAPIPAGELSAMLAELSSMENTTDSEYASETSEYEEVASEEFASDSEEFAPDEF
jgi:hypothetical protein